MTIPSGLIPDRSAFAEITAHGLGAHLAVELSDFPSETVGQLKVRDSAEVAYVMNTTVHRNASGTRVWNITGLPGTTYSIHLPLSAPTRGRVPDFDQLYVGSVWIEARALESAGRIASLWIYDGSTRVASFDGLSRRQLRRSDVFRLDEIVPISDALDLAIRLETPVGSLSSFEVAHAGALIVEDVRLIAETGPATSELE